MSENILVIDSESFQDFIDKNEVTLVDFWAPWCSPCKMLLPLIEDISIQYKENISIAKVNVDESPSLAQKYGVRGIPTLLIFKEGKVIGTKVGNITRSELITFIDEKIN